MEKASEETPLGTIRSFVLRAGRMSDAQRRSYEALAPRFCIPYEKRTLDFRALFENHNPVIVEIGFGMGDATAQLAEQNRNINYIGIEVHRPGVGKLLWEIEQRSLENIRIIEHDAVEVLKDMLSPESVDGFHIFFPDPWPKKRHHKRRLIKRPFTDLLVSRMEKGAYVYMSTDWADYGSWALEEFSATPGLENPYGGFAPRQEWRPLTKFEKKGLDKAHEVHEIYMVRSKH
ncbi:MAG TPA: tRNA (guanosine(46)-N7)-methyltransferase TrmB [Treponema sp.]|nr:tRNA (guanosine(46)-N7)-methyltransferase TrmB [Treponema sp.]HRS02851.1 tRNA (guanosine(46)-N7)-methyltransferase TrmB [Treponema sp.]